MSEYIVDLAEGYANTVLDTKEEIVRCSDCKYSRNYGMLGYGCLRSNNGYTALPVTPNGFCAWGERRDDELNYCPNCGAKIIKEDGQ